MCLNVECILCVGAGSCVPVPTALLRDAASLCVPKRKAHSMGPRRFWYIGWPLCGRQRGIRQRREESGLTAQPHTTQVITYEKVEYDIERQREGGRHTHTERDTIVSEKHMRYEASAISAVDVFGAIVKQNSEVSEVPNSVVAASLGM